MNREIVKIDLPMLASSAALLGLTALDGTVGRADGVSSLCRSHCLWSLRSADVQAWFGHSGQDRGGGSGGSEARTGPPAPAGGAIKLVGGAAVLYFAAQYTIKSVIELSTLVDIGTDVIAISAVALGTSLPELVVSVVAARRGNLDIAIGNVLGSSIFNAFAVAGIPALIAPLPVTHAVLTIGLPFMAVATVLFFFMAQDREVTRWEGMPLVLFYVLFLGRLFKLF